jgi:hypothetical protein
MVGQVQQPGAASARKRKALERADTESGHTFDGEAMELRQSKPNRLSKAEGAQNVPPPLPLDEAETELCERLASVLAKAPRRCSEAVPVTRVEISDRIATPAEVVPEPAELPPLVELPTLDTATGGPRLRSIKWVRQSRRARLKAALGYSAAWAVTMVVIAITVIGATLVTLGSAKSLELATIAWTHGAETASSVVALLKGLSAK